VSHQFNKVLVQANFLYNTLFSTTWAKSFNTTGQKIFLQYFGLMAIDIMTINPAKRD